MTWTARPKVDARAVAQAMARAMCEGALQRRLAAGPLPDAPLFQEELAWQDERIKVGRRQERDWTDEDWWHMLALAAAGFLVAFAGTVALLEMSR